jgi:hypothetical protein
MTSHTLQPVQAHELVSETISHVKEFSASVTGKNDPDVATSQLQDLSEFIHKN